jgi:uncharacterized protein (DUF1697 family)
MEILISMLRGINVGGHNLIKMEALRELYGSLKFENPRSYVQSGNVVFGSKEKDLKKIARKIEDAIEREFGCRPDVILRTTEEMRDVIKRNPFKGDREAAKMVVSFLASDPDKEAPEKIRAIKVGPEELILAGRELYMYYPDGMGKSKVTGAMLDKALKVRGTARNWNSVRKLLEMAEATSA